MLDLVKKSNHSEQFWAGQYFKKIGLAGAGQSGSKMGTEILAVQAKRG